MNGAEQKERQTAVARLEREVKRVEDEALNAFECEVAARLKATEELKSIFAQMMDDETTYRKRAMQDVYERVMDETRMLGSYIGTFVHLPWWRRYLWTVFGSASLLWFPGKPKQHPTTAELPGPGFANVPSTGKAVYRGEKP